MTRSDRTAAAPRGAGYAISLSLVGDRLVLAVLTCCSAFAVAVGWHFGHLALAAWVAGAVWLAGAAVYAAAAGTAVSRYVLAAALAAITALQIQLGAGMTEFHFGVFVTLGLMLIYRDWRLLVFTAALFALHHVAFDRLQAMGYGLYCLSEPDFWRVMLHASYVVAQTGVEVFMAVRMRQDTNQGRELSALVTRLDGGQTIRLDVSDIDVRTPAGKMLKASILKMQAALAEVAESASEVNLAASEIAAGNLDLSARTEQQASSVQQTASTMGDIARAIGQSTEVAQSARGLADAASGRAVHGGQVMNEVESTMAGITASSRKVSDIVSVIDSIAFQTNILALNAAVEAARAGDQGRGFAVVAAEVRSLAQRSAGSAREIKSLIESSLERVEAGSAQVQQAGASMRDIVDAVQQVNGLIGDISRASVAQNQGIGEVNTAVVQLDEMTQRNAALVEQAAAAAASLRDQAARLSQVLSVFSLKAA